MQGMLPTKARDDAGRIVRLVSFATLCTDDRRGDAEFDAIVDQYESIRAAVQTKQHPGLTLGTGYLMLLFFGSIFLPPTAFWPLAACSGFAVAAVGVWLTRHQKIPDGHPIITLLTAHGICPACAYALPDPAMSDGELRVTCPECGATWRVARIRRRHQFSTTDSTRISHTLLALLDRFPSPSRRPAPIITVDALYVRRQIVSPNLALQILAAAGDHQERLIQAQRELRSARRPIRFVWAALACLMYLVFALNGIRHINTMPAMSTAIIIPLFLWCAIALAISIVRRYPSPTADAIRHVMLSRSLCPACAADLAPVEPDPVRGGRICPQCHAAWGHSAALLKPTDCRRCHYPLTDLQPDERGHVTCPECGRSYPATPHALAAERVRCPECRESLAGKALTAHGRVRCDRCGLWITKFTQHDLDLAAEANSEPRAQARGTNLHHPP
ncbi:MAG: hypothetical protein IPJ41_04510 [Phycisphaerales bacterium]|nr:hypothetical protein [Phycisphaerales bacterium]